MGVYIFEVEATLNDIDSIRPGYFEKSQTLSPIWLKFVFFTSCLEITGINFASSTPAFSRATRPDPRLWGVKWSIKLIIGVLEYV